MLFKEIESNKKLLSYLSNDSYINDLKCKIREYLGLDPDEDLYSENSDLVSENEGNVTLEINEVAVKDMIQNKEVRLKEKVFNYNMPTPHKKYSPNKPNFF